MIKKVTVTRITSIFIVIISLFNLINNILMFQPSLVIIASIFFFFLFLIGGIFLFVYPDNKTLLLFMLIFNCVILLFVTIRNIDNAITLWKNFTDIGIKFSLNQLLGVINIQLTITLVLLILITIESKVGSNY